MTVEFSKPVLGWNHLPPKTTLDMWNQDHSVNCIYDYKKKKMVEKEWKR